MYETRKKTMLSEMTQTEKEKYDYVFVIVFKSIIIKLKYVESQRLGRE